MCRVRLRRNAVENQNSNQPMQFLVIQRSYIPSFIIVRLQTTEVKEEQKNQAACACGATRPKIKFPLSPYNSRSCRVRLWRNVA